MKVFGYGLIAFSMIQAHLWIFGFVNLTEMAAQFFYAVFIGLELLLGLLAAKIIKPL
jgi:hypothetical protein